MTPVSIGVVGLGYWGPNLARNFDRLPDTELAWICDASEDARARWSREFPAARASGDPLSVILIAAESDGPASRRLGH